MTPDFKAVLSFKTYKANGLIRILEIDYAFNTMLEKRVSEDFITNEIISLCDLFTDMAKEKLPEGDDTDIYCIPLPSSCIFIQSEKSRTSVHHMIDITLAYNVLGSYDNIACNNKLLEFMQKTGFYSFTKEEYERHLSDSRR